MIFFAAEIAPNKAIPAGLDYGYLALVVAVLLILGGAWIYANRRLSNFNGENSKKKKDTEEQLSQDIYREGTAPLVLAVSSYISEQVIVDFEPDEQEVIQRYEDARITRINPADIGFINLSNFADTIEYDQKVQRLIEAHSAIEKHNDNYEKMKKNLRYLTIVIWFPIFAILGSLLLHFAGFVLFNDTSRFNYLVQVILVLGCVFAAPTIFLYISYMNCVRRLDYVEEIK